MRLRRLGDLDKALPRIVGAAGTRKEAGIYGGVFDRIGLIGKEPPRSRSMNAT